MGFLIDAILSGSRCSIADLIANVSSSSLEIEAAQLDQHVFQKPMMRVRALMFLHYIYRTALTGDSLAPVSYAAHLLLCEAKYEQAIKVARASTSVGSVATSSFLATAYRLLAFELLATEVRSAVENVPGNGFLFSSHLEQRGSSMSALAEKEVLREQTPVRMDLSHSCWSDIFFLAMDDPSGARVINCSVDLSVVKEDGSAPPPTPPVECFVRRIEDKGLIILTSIDLNCRVEIRSLAELFDFSRDMLGLLKAAIVASGVVPPWKESSAAKTFEDGGFELVSRVKNIPKGSRLAVSTTLLACAISCLMRASGQAVKLGVLDESSRRLVCSRAILAEWLAGSGGGWQDSGGVWPGFKQILGVEGALLPRHEMIDGPAEILRRSLVVCHAGMASNVGPVLELVTEKYMLRLDVAARQEARANYDSVLQLLRECESDPENALDKLGKLLTANFLGPVRSIVPQAHNAYTQSLLDRVSSSIPGYLGFVMHGGISGGGCGFLFKPENRDAAVPALLRILRETKRSMEHVLPFAMDPVVYDWSVNSKGTFATLCESVPSLAPAKKSAGSTQATVRVSVDEQLMQLTQKQLRDGVIGLLQNRISGCELSNVLSLPFANFSGGGIVSDETVAVVVLAGGLGTRWTKGSGTVKALSPFVQMPDGRFWSFLDLHAAKLKNSASPLFVCTSFLTHDAIAAWNEESNEGRAVLIRGELAARRLFPTRALLEAQFAGEPAISDPNKSKARDQSRAALLSLADRCGGDEYVDDDPTKSLHPPGHFFEVVNVLFRSKVLLRFPKVKTLLVHNCDTTGVSLDAQMLKDHRESKEAMTMEVIARRYEDRGGGLALIDKKMRIVEGLAMTDQQELNLSFYSTNSTWIEVDRLFSEVGFSRPDLADESKVENVVASLQDRIQSYVTLKEVKRRVNELGHEDCLPVAQCEKLWGDVSALISTRFVQVPLFRGAQLKDMAQLDGWLQSDAVGRVYDMVK